MSLTGPTRRACVSQPPFPKFQTRSATLIRRPKRPYTFTQLVTLSDGSTYTHRTTSPAPVYKCTKDTRNTPLWNPSSQKLMNVEADEAGKLRAFREKFGRGWDASRGEREDDIRGQADGQDGKVSESVDGSEGHGGGEDNLMDLISGYGQEAEAERKAGGVREGREKGGKRKGG